MSEMLLDISAVRTFEVKEEPEVEVKAEVGESEVGAEHMN